MIYIRRKDNPLLIRAFGSAESGGLGAYNSAEYEEVIADELPEGWILEEPELPLDTKIRMLYKSLPLASRVRNAIVFKTCQLMLQLDDLEGALDYLTNSDLDSGIKESAIAFFKQII